MHRDVRPALPVHDDFFAVVHLRGVGGQLLLAGAALLGQPGVEQDGEREPGAPVGDQGGRTWSLTTAKADEGVVEDYSLRFSPNVPPVLSFVPEHVFTVGRGE